MKQRRKKLNYISALSYLTLFFVFLCLSRLEKTVLPYSVSALSFALANGLSSAICCFLFLLSFLAQGQFNLTLSMAVACVILVFGRFIHYKSHKKNNLPFVGYTALSLLFYLFMNSLSQGVTIEKRLTVCLFTTLLTFLIFVGGNAAFKKGFKYKLGYDEYASIIVVTVIFGLGVSNLVSPLFWKGVCALVIPFICYTFSFGVGAVVSGVLGISLAIYYGNLILVSVFLVWGIACSWLMPTNRFAGALIIPLADILVQILFRVYPSYAIIDFIPALTGSLLFCIIPNKFFTSVKQRINFFKEKQLVRQTINRNKIMLSNRLYELSGVFREIKATFESFNNVETDNEKIKKIIIKETLHSVCENCDKNKNCVKRKYDKEQALYKMVEIGFAKGKLTLIDLPRELGDVCAKPSEILYCVNKLLAGYRNYRLERKNANIGRELLSQEAGGVAEILSGLALESSATLSFQSKLEKTISENLFKAGYGVSELLVYGEGDNLSVSMILTMSVFSVVGLERILSKTLNRPMALCDKNNILEDKVYLVFKYQAPYDAVFGVSKITKENSFASGDTYSVMKISEDKFLVALSDGMGSGENAEKISSTALSLIESFYKAGLSSNLILNTVNKLLSLNQEENFTALDISVIDLKTCQADFIKYGSPYGFIIGDNGIKIVEGNSLPLGILNELKPAVCHTDLKEENTLLFLSDGVSDAFGSSSEVIEYLRSVPCLNPQSLADGILNKAVEKNNGSPNDDMTALAVRIYKKKVV